MSRVLQSPDTVPAIGDSCSDIGAIRLDTQVVLRHSPLPSIEGDDDPFRPLTSLSRAQQEHR